MNESRREILGYLENVSLLLVGILLVAFPLVFSTLMTDAFSLPKQLLLGVVALISLILFGIRIFVEGKVKLRTTPFDLPLLIFTVVVAVSAYLSVNRYDALTAFVPLLFAILIYFVIVNITRTEKNILFLVSALIIGAVVTSLLSLLQLTKLYILPFDYTHNQTFTPLGSLLDQAMYLALVLPIAGYIAWPLMGRGNAEGERPQMTPKMLSFAGAFIIMILGLASSLFVLLTMQKPLILPFETGFQTGLAAISQDTGRVLTSFLFGSGFGTYLTDFTRFKQASYNANPDLWSFTFFRSSSFLLELLATTGFLGVLSFLFLLYRIVKQRVLFLPIIIIAIAGFLLPFSPTLQTLFFVILAIFASLLALHEPRRFPDFEFQLVALRRGLFSATPEGEHESHHTHYSRVLPGIFFLVILLVVGALGYLSGMYILSDVTFQRSLVAASQNDGAQTYSLQAQAINDFKYRDSYYRIFSQTNLALANSLASAQPKNSSPSAQVQQNILTLIQQSINAGRTAVTVSPETALDWNNLSSIYRSLIGFGQNADKFSVITNQQAAALDPTNPQQYVNLGGIYYQVGDWNDAATQFAQAIQLKKDYANAWYNYGHALEAKGDLDDLKSALTAYQQVQALVANDKTNSQKISAEIAALQKKIASGGTQPASTQPQPSATPTPEPGQQNLNVNQPGTQLPERNPKATIPGPAVSVTPVTSKTTSTSPTPAAGGKTTVTPQPTK